MVSSMAAFLSLAKVGCLWLVGKTEFCSSAPVPIQLYLTQSRFLPAYLGRSQTLLILGVLGGSIN
ncbi:MAG: hypothetical protein PUP93_18090 [Rhizonema sp. NSF051]|nr:hypothetical protein [Rhizonema sp. NSF051]